MIFTDTHTHLYLDAFDADRNEVIRNAINQEVQYMLLPNIDSNTANALLKVCGDFPGHCFPMMGLHPTSVNENYREELEQVRTWHERKKFVAVGEIGIDLYWDKSYRRQQEEAFRFQIELALEKNLPIVIHSRESFDEIIAVLNDYRERGLTGVFHCFTGNITQARQAIDLGFYLGIGGVVTFKNSGLSEVVAQVDLKHILLETDSPFLAPMPFRGKRNESAYIHLVASRIALLKNLSREEIAGVTTRNALNLFNFDTL